MTADEVVARIRSLLPDALVELAGADCHFEVAVVSPTLGGRSQLARQRMVLELFQQELASGALHALSVHAHTPTELADARDAARNLSVR